jgi:hypothetical protein
MSRHTISSSLSAQDIQNIIDGSKPWDTFTFEPERFALDATLYLKPEGRLYNGNGCVLSPSPLFQGMSLLSILSAPPAKRNLFQWIGSFFLRLVGKRPRAAGATITGFTITGNTSTDGVTAPQS